MAATDVRVAYVYQEVWSNGRVYIGWTLDPQRRHRQHIGEISGGSRKVKEEIERQSGIKPKMVVLDTFNPDIIFTQGSHPEHIFTQVAKKAGVNLIYEDMGWPPSLEACARGGRKSMTSERAAEFGRKNGKMKTPALQKARREMMRKINSTNSPATQKARLEGFKTVSTETRRDNIKRMPREILQENGRKNGRRNGIKSRARFVPKQIYEIRKRLDTGESCASIACDYLVSRRTINSIKHGHRYAWVDKGN